MSLFGKVRKLVSQDRIRFQEEGFDLDLCYVTKNIVAMSMPSTGMTAMWRNNIEDIKRLLESRHPQSYLIFNLSESKYDYDFFNNQILEFPFPDHHAPPFKLLFTIVNAVDSWIQASSENVAIVHCKGGKGRTGVVIVCWLMYSALFPAISDAAKHFAAKRSSTEKGVTQPSQVRYLTYYSNTLLIGHEFPQRQYNIVSIFFGPLPKQFSSDFSVQILAYHGLTSDELFSADDSQAQPMNDNYFQMKIGIPVMEDVLIRFFHKHTSSTPKKLFHIVFHTSFLNARDHDICFLRRDLDNPSKKIPASFTFSCEMQRLPDPPAVPESTATPQTESPIQKMCQVFQQRVRRKNASLGSHRGHLEITTKEEQRRMQLKREERRDEFAAQAKSTTTASTPAAESGGGCHWNFTVPGASHGESLQNETSKMLSRILDDSLDDCCSTTPTSPSTASSSTTTTTTTAAAARKSGSYCSSSSSGGDLSSSSSFNAGLSPGSKAVPIPTTQKSFLDHSNSEVMSTSLPSPPSCLPPEALFVPLTFVSPSLPQPPLSSCQALLQPNQQQTLNRQSSSPLSSSPIPTCSPRNQTDPPTLSASSSSSSSSFVTATVPSSTSNSQTTSLHAFQVNYPSNRGPRQGFLSNQRSCSMTQLPSMPSSNGENNNSTTNPPPLHFEIKPVIPESSSKQ